MHEFELDPAFGSLRACFPNITTSAPASDLAPHLDFVYLFFLGALFTTYDKSYDNHDTDNDLPFT